MTIKHTMQTPKPYFMSFLPTPHISNRQAHLCGLIGQAVLGDFRPVSPWFFAIASYDTNPISLQEVILVIGETRTKIFAVLRAAEKHGGGFIATTG
jgi:hypothetical protein